MTQDYNPKASKEKEVHARMERWRKESSDRLNTATIESRVIQKPPPWWQYDFTTPVTHLTSDDYRDYLTHRDIEPFWFGKYHPDSRLTKLTFEIENIDGIKNLWTEEKSKLTSALDTLGELIDKLKTSDPQV